MGRVKEGPSLSKFLTSVPEAQEVKWRGMESKDSEGYGVQVEIQFQLFLPYLMTTDYALRHLCNLPLSFSCLS